MVINVLNGSFRFLLECKLQYKMNEKKKAALLNGSFGEHRIIVLLLFLPGTISSTNYHTTKKILNKYKHDSSSCKGLTNNCQWLRKCAVSAHSLFMSLLLRSLMPLSESVFRGVPVLEDAWLLGVSARGVPGLRLASELEEPRRSDSTAGLPRPPSRWRALAVFRTTSGSSEPSSEKGTGSARVLCLTELRLCARTRDQLVERKLSASSQKRARWSAPWRSVKCM